MSFTFKQFHIDDSRCGMKVCTDSVLLGAWADISQAKSIVDLGTGSGLLALMCAQRNPDAQITGVEIDADACECARFNFEASPWAERISLVNANALLWHPSLQVDLVISNPPYFTTCLLSPESKRAMARHGMTLDKKTEYNFLPVSVLNFASQHLSPQGSISMVTPAEIEKELLYEGTLRHLYLRRICRVRSRRNKPFSRILTQWSRIDGVMHQQEITIGDETCREITSEFYL